MAVVSTATARIARCRYGLSIISKTHSRDLRSCPTISLERVLIGVPAKVGGGLEGLTAAVGVVAGVASCPESCRQANGAVPVATTTNRTKTMAILPDAVGGLKVSIATETAVREALTMVRPAT